MRILVVNWRDLAHPRAGGSEVYAQNLARVWSAEGHDVTYFCAEVKDAPAREQQDGYSVVRKGGRLSVYREAKAVISRARSDGYDAILDVVNTRPFLSPRYCGGVPTVALIYQTAEDVWRYEMPRPLAWLGRHILEPHWLRSYTNIPVLTISESSRLALERFGLRCVRVVPVGSDLATSPVRSAKETNFTAVFVGRMAANKRPNDAIQAFSVARDRLGFGELWMIGDGPMLPALQAQAPLGVTFFGFIDSAKKWDLMARSHVLLATSVREGWGMTVSEAARLGTRSVGYDVPGLRDSVAAAGGTLTLANPNALAEALVENAERWMSQPFEPSAAGTTTWDTVAELVLGELIAAAHRRPK